MCWVYDLEDDALSKLGHRPTSIASVSEPVAVLIATVMRGDDGDDGMSWLSTYSVIRVPCSVIRDP
eukprot:2423771-Rhodomonas_salina.1